METQHRPSLEAEVTKVLDEALETLRWCRLHPEERSVGERLRELETKLGYLAQALSWQADGEIEKSAIALGVAQGRSRRQQLIDQRLWEEGWWSH
jgi:hypothetical protein